MFPKTSQTAAPDDRRDVGRYGIRLRRFAGPGRHVHQLERPLRVAHLTDLHVGRMTPLRIQAEAARMVNAETPDLVAITGDFVCHSQAYLEDLAETIRHIDAPVFAVLGNHDHWCGAADVRKALRRGGAEILDNANTVVNLDGQVLQLVGLDDAYTGHADLEKAIRGLRPELPTLGLSHIAEEADGLWYHGVPLVLAGHTHGGQVTVARLHELTLGRLAGHRYVHGLYGDRDHSEEHGAVYVSAGIGAAVMPVRFGDRGKREVAVFELGSSRGDVDEHHGEQRPLPGRKPTQRKIERRHGAVIEKRLRRERRSGRNGDGDPRDEHDELGS